MKRKLISASLVACMVLPMLPAFSIGAYAVAPGTAPFVNELATKNDVASKNPFTDIHKDDWFYEPVLTAFEKGWFPGTTDTEFSPNAITTRGDVAVVLHKMEGMPKAAATTFLDVKAGTWYYDGVSWAQEKLLLKGYENGTYAPDDGITREQLVTILYRYAQNKGAGLVGDFMINMSQYTDLGEVSSWANEAFVWAKINGVMEGTSGNTLSPKAVATRADVAAAVVRLSASLK